jgi:hypothetical protein
LPVNNHPKHPQIPIKNLHLNLNPGSFVRNSTDAEPKSRLLKKTTIGTFLTMSFRSNNNASQIPSACPPRLRGSSTKHHRDLFRNPGLQLAALGDMAQKSRIDCGPDT